MLKKRITKHEIAKFEMPSLLKVAAYARVSSGKDDMLHSLAAQVSYYSNHIQQHTGWIYAGVYADEACTGTKKSRPEFKRLIEDCRKGKIDLVLTKSISRFARNTVDLLEAVRELKDLNVDVFFEEQNLHTMSGDGELMLAILASYAQEESLSASENQKWRIRNSYKEGKPSNHISILGYENTKGVLTIIPKEAEVIRMIHTDYLSGMGRNAIMRKLMRLEIPTKHGGKWCESGIETILKNEKYVGDMLLQKGYLEDHLSKLWKRNNGELPQYYIENHHEPIIDRDTYAAVQKKIASHAVRTTQRPARPRDEFFGIIHCQHCGAHFRKKTYAYGTKYAKDSWTCSTFITYGKRHCQAKRIPEDILKEKCAKVLGLQKYDPVAFADAIKEITVPDNGKLVFTFKDGRRRQVLWENRSRREGWTDDMKAAAKERASRGGRDV
jgi:DNA invertase Pin-like site-specific DNA recombinase